MQKLYAIFSAGMLVISVATLSQQPLTGDGGSMDDFDLDALVDQIAHSKALGFLTKLSLKRDIDGFLKDVRNYHEGKGGNSLEQLRERYDVLVHKLVVLLQDGDRALVKSIDDSRDKLWAVIADEKKFASL